MLQRMAISLLAGTQILHSFFPVQQGRDPGGSPDLQARMSSLQQLHLSCSVEWEQIGALCLLSTRHGKEGGEKKERSPLNADPATVGREQKGKLFHIGSMWVFINTTLFGLKAILSLANTVLIYQNEKKWV